MKRILFVCANNAALSQMAEGFARSFAGETIEAYSAGLQPTDLVDDRAVDLMAEVGCDLQSHRSKGLDALRDMHFDAVISIDEQDLAVPLDAGTRIHWQVADPTQLDTAGYRDARHALGRKVRQLLTTIDASIVEPAAEVALELSDE